MRTDVQTDFELDDIFSPDSEEGRQLAALVQEFRRSPTPPKAGFGADSDPSQRAFIDSRSDTIRLLAPAGSGKTQSIAHRVARLVAEGHDPKRILMLTFDNAAKVSLDHRVRQVLLGTARLPDVSTLNGFGNRLLGGLLNDLYPGLSLSGVGVAEKHKALIIARALHQVRQDRPHLAPFFPRKFGTAVYRDIFSVFKNQIITPANLRTPDGKATFGRLVQEGLLSPWLDGVAADDERQRTLVQIANAILTVYGYLWKEMRKDGCLDFDDQKLLPYLALSSDDTIAKRVRAQFDTIIVDEFQDINRLDFELIKAISEGRSLVVVGDDDQAIYGFRGCTPDYIIDFANAVGRSTETHELEVNYRSPQNIVSMAKQLIEHNTRRVPKNTRTPPHTATADIKLWHSVNAASEAQIIARTIKQIVDAQSGVQYSDVAVLYRLNSQSLPLQMAFILNEIPYYCRREENLILSDQMEKIVRLLELNLQLIKDPHYTTDEAAKLLYESFFRWHQFESRDEFVRRCRLKKRLSGAALELESLDSKWRGFASAVAGLEREHRPVSAIEHIGRQFRHLDVLVGSLEQALEDHLPLGELVDIAQRFKGSTKDFVGVLNDLARRAREGLFAEGEQDGVNLLTYFRSKGRQWHTVFLPGVNQRVIPHSRGKTEEERRLFYVAITRATADMVLSYVRSAVRERVVPSQFLAEMGMGDGQEKRASAGL